MYDIRCFLFWTLLPFVVPQGLKLKMNAPRLSAPPGPVSGQIGSGKTVRFLAIGDSVIAGVGAPSVGEALPGQIAFDLAKRLDCKAHWEAVGRIGATCDTIRSRLLPSLDSDPFDFIALSVGVNDITSLRTVKQWSNELDLLLEELKTHSPNASIAFVGLPPLSAFPLLPQPLRAVMGIRSRIFDDVAQGLIKRHDTVVHVPLHFDGKPDEFSPDGYHPSTSSHSLLGEMVSAALCSTVSGNKFI